MFEAYDVEAFQYLLKPVEDRKLKNVLQKAVLKTERRSQEFIIVSSERQKKKLFLDDIYYFEIKGRIVDAHGPEGIFTYYEQMGELENKLQDKGFFRCHKSYLVNPFAAFLYPVFFIGLVVALFRSDREKRILAASVLVAVRLAADFSASFLSCLELVFLHIVKKIPEPFSEEWVIVADA